MTTLKLGYTNPLTDTFGAHPLLGAVLDLNDGATFALVSPDGLELAPPEKTLVPSGNIRTQGERITRSVYRRNREAVARVILGPGSSYASLVASVRTLLAWVNAAPQTPVTLQWQPPSASAPVYLDVVGAACAISSDEAEWLQLQFEPLEVVFICRPGLRGDRVTLANGVVNPGFEGASGPGVLVFNDGFANASAYTLVAGSAPFVGSNLMTVAGNSTLTFGDTAWGAINLWQFRFIWSTGNVVDFCLHYANASYRLVCTVDGTKLYLDTVASGTYHDLSTPAAALTSGNAYWLQITQFPGVSSNPTYLQAVLYNDAGGAIGSLIATAGAPSFDATTATQGVMGIVNRTATNFVMGGAFTGVHVVRLFGPGGWSYVQQSGGAGISPGGWETSWGNYYAPLTYPNGPVASFGAARITTSPVGGPINSYWQTYGGGAPAGTSAIPVGAPGNVVYASAYTKSNSLSNTGQILLVLVEYDASGAYLRQTTLRTLTGNQASWAQLSGHVTTGANCAYVGVVLNVIENTAAASANAIVWFDNTQCWDSTRAGSTSMPYCELRFAQSPCQLLVSGLLGDLAAPCYLAWGTFLGSWARGGSLTYAIGRRGQVSSKGQMAASAVGFSGAGANPQAVEVGDAGSFGGSYSKVTLSNAVAWAPRGVSPAVADLAGVFHLLGRVRSQDVSPAGVTVRVKSDQNLDPWFTDVGTLASVGVYYGPYTSPLASVGAWSVVDAGQVNIPPFAQGALSDPTQTYIVPRPEWLGSGVTGYEFDADWEMLVPVDGSLALGVVNYPSNSGVATITNEYLWCYLDGLLVNRAAVSDGPSWSYSLETIATPNPAHGGGGPGTGTTAAINVNSAADPYITLDPQLTLSGQSGGINTFAAVVYDQAGSVLPFYGEVQYSPLYLYPR